MRKQKELFDLMKQRVLTQDKTLNAFIKVAQNELTELEKEAGGGHSFEEIKCLIEDEMGIRISMMETSVSEFYGYLKYMKSRSAKRKTSIENGD